MAKNKNVLQGQLIASPTTGNITATNPNLSPVQGAFASVAARQAQPVAQTVQTPVSQAVQQAGGVQQLAKPATPAPAVNPYEQLISGVQSQIASNAKAQTEAANARKDNYLSAVDDQYNKWLEGYNEIHDAYLQRATERQARDEAAAKANYDNAARQNYVNYMQAQKQLPAQLRQLGINGGASESSLIRLGANYGTNVANTEMARAQALDNIANQYADMISEFEQEYRQAILARDDAKATQISQYLDNMEKELSGIEASKNEALTNAYATGMENAISYQERRDAEAREDKIRKEGYARDDRLLAEANAREDRIRQEGYERDDRIRAEDLVIAKEQRDYERARADLEYKDAQKAKMLEEYAAGLARYQSEDALKKMAENIKKDKNWAKDPFKYGKVQAINARIGEIRAEKNK